MKKIAILTIFFFSLPLFSKEKQNRIVEYHFEYGFGLSDFTEYPKKEEKGNVIPFPILDEYLVGLSVKKKNIEILPMIGVIEIEDYHGKIKYKPSSGVIIKRKNLHFKITNGGFSIIINI